MQSVTTWICAGLFLLFGIVMALSDDPSRRTFFAGLSCIALGCFAVSMMLDAVASGVLRLQHSVIRRADRPLLFRAAVTLFTVTGLGVVGAGLWLIVFKA